MIQTTKALKFIDREILLDNKKILLLDKEHKYRSTSIANTVGQNIICTNGYIKGNFDPTNRLVKSEDILELGGIWARLLTQIIINIYYGNDHIKELAHKFWDIKCISRILSPNGILLKKEYDADCQAFLDEVDEFLQKENKYCVILYDQPEISEDVSQAIVKLLFMHCFENCFRMKHIIEKIFIDRRNIINEPELQFPDISKMKQAIIEI